MDSKDIDYPWLNTQNLCSAITLLHSKIRVLTTTDQSQVKQVNYPNTHHWTQSDEMRLIFHLDNVDFFHYRSQSLRSP